MKLHYGISVASAGQLSELPDFAAADFLELPSYFCEACRISVPEKWKTRVRRFSCRRESAALISLMDAGSAVQMDFFREFGGCCAAFAAVGVKEVSLGIDWETVLSGNCQLDRLRKILACCFGITSKYGMRVLLELRIPGTAANDIMGFLKFRNSLMFPVRTLIDLHPHEPAALDMLARLYDRMPFECDNFRISFDAAGGNYMSGKLLEMIRRSLRQVGPEIPEICFYPGRNADKTAFELLSTVIS